MKRFLADAILILILVGLGGYVQKQDEKVPSIEAEVEAFEDTIAQHKRITPKNTKVHLLFAGTSGSPQRTKRSG